MTERPYLSAHRCHLSLASCPSSHPPAGLSVCRLLGLRGGIVSNHAEAELLYSSFFSKAGSISKVKALNVVLEVVLHDVVSWDCFSFSEMFWIVNSVGLGDKALEKGVLDSVLCLFLSL